MCNSGRDARDWHFGDFWREGIALEVLGVFEVGGGVLAGGGLDEGNGGEHDEGVEDADEDGVPQDEGEHVVADEVDFAGGQGWTGGWSGG